MAHITVDDLHTTVQRMEQRLGGRDEDLARRLMSAYAALVPRFAQDLVHERDELLSRAGALMLIQAVLDFGWEEA